MDRIGAAVVLIALFSFGCSPRSHGVGDPASPNGVPVPSVVGRTLPDACRALDADRYTGGVSQIDQRSEKPPGTVLAQDPAPGSNGAQGQVIMVTVAGPVDLTDLPQGCVSRIPRGY